MRGFFSRLFHRGKYARMVAIDKLGNKYFSDWEKCTNKDLSEVNSVVNNDLTYISFYRGKGRISVQDPVSIVVEVR